MPELRRAHELATVVGLPAGSIAKLLRHEYGHTRSPNAIRHMLHKHFDWHSTKRGHSF